MKPTAIVFLGLAALTGILHSQQKEPPAAPEPAVELLGKLPDGTPPPPQPPKPGFIAAVEDVLSSDTVREGGRTITVQEIAPIDLPPPPSDEPAAVPLDPATKARFAALRARRPQITSLSLGATVYLTKDGPARSLVRYWLPGDQPPIIFWSSADFSLLAGVGDFFHQDGKTRRLMLMWSPIQLDRNAALLAKRGRTYTPPVIPELPGEKATFLIASGTPSASNLADIQALHDLYNSQFDKLKAAAEGREDARLREEAELKAHPLQPKDIILNHWTVQPATQGGDQ